MVDQEALTTALGDAGVLGGIRWAYLSAARQCFEDFSEPAGHDAAWLGYTRYVLFRDRLDRLFSCGRYVLRPEAEDDTAGLDLVNAALSAEDIRAMPHLPNDLVV